MDPTTQFINCFEPGAALCLESGQSLGPITIAYETYGQLNADRSNAILVCHALTGSAHAAGQTRDGAPDVGWWDSFIGPGKTLDTDRYFVICTNVLGGCKGTTGPNSTNPATGKPYGLDFPVISIGDMVNVQKQVIDHLGIDKLKMVIGGSMGGMQVLEWAIMYPDKMESCVPIATCAQLSPQALAFNAVARYAIMTDPNFDEGHFYTHDPPKNGLSIARMIGHITYLSEKSISKKFGRKLQEKTDYGYDFSADFQIESYLKYQGDKLVTRFDANSYLYLSKTVSYFDLGKKYGGIENALDKVLAKFLVISIASDWIYPAHQSKELVKTLMKLNKEVTYSNMTSEAGHDAFLIDHDQLGYLVKHFLDNL